jgi:primosomal protein N' (replication factor Y)
VTGSFEAVAAAVAAVNAPPEDILGPVETAVGAARTIIRFDYARGAEVASDLRAEVIRSATSRRRPLPGRSGPSAVMPNLRVRFDDVEPFAQ